MVGDVIAFMSVSPGAYMNPYYLEHNIRLPNIFKAILTLRFYETETGRIASAAQGLGKAKEKMVNGKYSAIQVQEALSNAINDAVNGKSGVIAKLDNKKNYPKKNS